jgi:hypothetical protein
MSEKITTKKEISYPIYDGKETMTQWLRKIQLFEVRMKSDKYNKILDFMNILLTPYEIKLCSLSDFKNISSKKITKDIIHNKRTLRKYGKKLAAELCVDVNAPELDDDTEDIEEDQIIKFIRSILKSIEYSLKWKQVDNIIYYTISEIKQRPKKN